jgi:hypothetical protein
MISNIDIPSSNLAVLESQVFDTVPIFFLTSTSVALTYLQQNPARALTFHDKKKICENILYILLYNFQDLESSLGIATRYGLEGAGIESRWGGEIFCTRPEWPRGPPSLVYNGYWLF